MGPSQRQMSRSRHVPVLRGPFASPFWATPPRKRVPMKLRSSDDEFLCPFFFLFSFLPSSAPLLLPSLPNFNPPTYNLYLGPSCSPFYYFSNRTSQLLDAHCTKAIASAVALLCSTLFNYIVRTIFTRCRLLLN